MESRVVPMRRPFVCSAGLAIAVVLQVARPAQALPLVGGELRVRRTEAASDCPDEQALGAATMALGAQATKASSHPLDVDVVLDRDETGYIARIHATGGRSGEREIRSASDGCGALADATSIALAILFDLLPEEPSVTASPTSYPIRQPSGRGTEPAADLGGSALQPPQRARPPVVWLGAHGGVARGLLGPTVTEHLGAALRVRLTRRLELGLGALGARGRELPHGPGTVSVFLVAGRSDVTLTLADSDRIQVGVQVGISSGAIVGSGAGYDHNYSTAALWLAPGVGAAGRWHLSRLWALTLSTTLLAPHRTQTFSVAEVPGTAFRGAPAAVLVELGAELALF
jgi:hypothetical protein